MKKYVIVLIIIFFVILGFVLYNYFKNQEINNSPTNNNGDKNDSELASLKENLPSNDNIEKFDSKDQVSTGGIGTSSGDNTNPTITLPSDINTQNCGFYYRNYGVCAGKCPEGKCVSEGRSCYCKNI